eukprot:jgi/Undpi1/7712/HiC_scaffold_23.g10185.m1
MSLMDLIGGRKLPLGEDEDVVSLGGSSIVVDIDDDDAFMQKSNAPKEQHQQQPVSHQHAQEQQQQRAGPGAETAAQATPETAKGGRGGDGAMPSAREPGSVEKEPSRSTPSQQSMTFCGRFAHLLSCTLAVQTSWVYNANALQTDLTQIPTEGKNMDTMVEAVKTVCKQHGVKVVESSSKKQAEKQVACTLSCVHGMPNRQGERQEATNGNNRKRRRSSSGRTGCDRKINVRWPAQSSDSKYPRITTTHLEHNHDVDREAVNAKEAQLGAVSTPMKEPSAKLTDVGMQPSDQAVVLEALHDRAVNPKVMQNAVSQHRQGGREFDGQDFLKKVRECTKDGGVYDVKLENGRRTHCFWMTAEQASLCSVFDFLSKAMEKARDRAILRSAQLILPSVQPSNVADFWLGDAVLAPCKFALGAWPYRFMVEEVTMASVFFSSPVNAVLEGSARGEALSKFEHIGMKGSKPTWAVAKDYKPLQAAELPAPLAATDGEQRANGDVEGGGEGAHEGGVRWNAGNETIESSLVQLKQTRPTPQDRRLLYVDFLKETTAAVNLGVETVPPEALRALVRQFKAGVVQAARLGSSAESSGPLPVANPKVVRLPSARGKGKRQRGSHESGNVVGSAVRAFAQSR